MRIFIEMVILIIVLAIVICIPQLIANMLF